MPLQAEAGSPAYPLAIVAGCSGASKGGSSRCSLRCAWLRSRFAPLTRPALPAILNAGRLRGMVLSVSPRNSRFFTTIILPISSRHIILCAPRSRLTHAPAPVLPPLIAVLRLTSPFQPLETSLWRGLPAPVSPKTTHTTTRRPQQFMEGEVWTSTRDHAGSRAGAEGRRQGQRERSSRNCAGSRQRHSVAPTAIQTGPQAGG